MKNNRLEKVKNFLTKLEKDNKIRLNKSLLNYLDDDFLNELINKKQLDPYFNDYFYKIYKKFYINYQLDINFTTYEEAIDFLKENDPSLKKSIAIVAGCDSKIDNFDSIILADDLIQSIQYNKIESLKDKINNFFQKL